MRRIIISWDAINSTYFYKCPFCNGKVVVSDNGIADCPHVIYAHETVNNLLIGEFYKIQIDVAKLLAKKRRGFLDEFDEFIEMNADGEGDKACELLADDFISQGGLSVDHLIRLIRRSDLSWLLKDTIIAEYIDVSGCGGTYYVLHPTHYGENNNSNTMSEGRSESSRGSSNNLTNANDVLAGVTVVVEQNTPVKAIAEQELHPTIPVIKDMHHVTNDEFTGMIEAYGNNVIYLPELMVAFKGLRSPISNSIALALFTLIRKRNHPYSWTPLVKNFKGYILGTDDQDLIYEFLEHIVSISFVESRWPVDGDISNQKEEAMEILRSMNTEKAQEIMRKYIR